MRDDPGAAKPGVELVLNRALDDQPCPKPVMRLPETPEGSITGRDTAGVVERAAADGSGSAAGARVVGLVNVGAWARVKPR